MVDIHAHILPGIDDGAQDLQDTLRMAEIAANSGVTAIVATPHCNIPEEYENYYGHNLVKTFRRAETAIREAGIPITLYAGMEVFVTPDLPQYLKEGKILTINGGHYILVEFGFEEDADFVTDMLDTLAYFGLIPVVAHAERYRFVQKDPQLVYEWCKKGYVIQCNKGSFTGRFGGRCAITAYELLEHNLVSVIASDAHSYAHRTPYMLDAYQELLNGYEPEYLDILFDENPKRICQDEPVVRMEMISFE